MKVIRNSRFIVFLFESNIKRIFPRYTKQILEWMIPLPAFDRPQCNDLKKIAIYFHNLKIEQFCIDRQSKDPRQNVSLQNFFFSEMLNQAHSKEWERQRSGDSMHNMSNANQLKASQLLPPLSKSDQLWIELKFEVIDI